jgi:hypothetical protein
MHFFLFQYFTLNKPAYAPKTKLNLRLFRSKSDLNIVLMGFLNRFAVLEIKYRALLIPHPIPKYLKNS